MKIGVFGEKSQVIVEQFLLLGHDAMSCDLLPGEKGLPHYQGDMWDIIDDSFDLGIFHPECKFLCWSGERWMARPGRAEKRQQAFKFLQRCYNAPIKKVCVENSLSWFLRRNWKWETQLVHPFHFGDPYRKSTCFWLRGLKPLIPTNIIFKREPAVHNEWPGPKREASRARFYPGMAKAMAEQWG